MDARLTLTRASKLITRIVCVCMCACVECAVFACAVCLCVCVWQKKKESESCVTACSCANSQSSIYLPKVLIDRVWGVWCMSEGADTLIHGKVRSKENHQTELSKIFLRYSKRLSLGPLSQFFHDIYNAQSPHRNNVTNFKFVHPSVFQSISAIFMNFQLWTLHSKKF